jgi:hypothetical protein
LPRIPTTPFPRQVPARRLAELASAGRLRGLELHVATDELGESASPSPHSMEPHRGLRLVAGGILLGLLPSEGASELAVAPATATRSTSGDAAWIWVACMLTTRELMVYADEAALQPVLRAVALLA